MSRYSWQLTANEFRLLWQAVGRDRFPYPLQPGPAIADRTDRDRIDRSAAADVAERFDEWLYRALQALAMPDVRVELVGYSGKKQDRTIRAHAAVHADAAAVAIQQPGMDTTHGGNIELTLCRAHSVPTRLAATLPACLLARGNPLSVYAADLERHPGRGSVLRDTRDVSPSEQMSRFLDRPRSSIGYVAIYPGDAVSGLDFHWMDFEHDGRYLTRAGKVLTAEPADSNAIADHIERLIAHAAHHRADARS